MSRNTGDILGYFYFTDLKGIIDMGKPPRNHRELQEWIIFLAYFLCWRMIQEEIIWVNYNELTTSSLEIIVSKGKSPQMALIQVSELL